MKIKEVKPGTKVKLHTRQGDFEAVILDSPSSEILLIKLNSGYNIGIKEEDILDLKILKKENEVEVKQEIVSQKKDLPNIALVVTGGTISSRLDSKTGAVKWLTKPEELLKFYPEILDIANVVKIEIPFMKASEDMDSKDWSVISETVAKLLGEDKIEGVVVTHGTDFLHYTAAALSFALGNLNKPVVLTYSQRSSDRASSDAKLNLKYGAKMAVGNVAEVVLVGHATNNDDYCFALRGTKVRKMHTSRRDTFRPINSRPVAKIFDDKIEILDKYNLRNNKKKINLISKFSDKVALVKFYPGMSPEVLDFYLEKKYKGVVIEASGLGHVSTKDSRNNLVGKIKKLVDKGVIVCIAPQTIYGKLDPLVYSNGRDLEKTGAIFLNDILPETAFVKLSWILGNAQLKKDVKENLLRNFAKEFSEFISEDEFLN
jgi:glutamyl-tRNA(Gln) amidotransferase subunit D